MRCSDFTKWLGTSLIVPWMAVGMTYPIKTQPAYWHILKYVSSSDIISTSCTCFELWTVVVISTVVQWLSTCFIIKWYIIFSSKLIPCLKCVLSRSGLFGDSGVLPRSNLSSTIWLQWVLSILAADDLVLYSFFFSMCNIFWSVIIKENIPIVYAWTSVYFALPNGFILFFHSEHKCT